MVVTFAKCGSTDLTGNAEGEGGRLEQRLGDLCSIQIAKPEEHSKMAVIESWWYSLYLITARVDVHACLHVCGACVFNFKHCVCAYRQEGLDALPGPVAHLV
jgi:hypothetical protein